MPIALPVTIPVLPTIAMDISSVLHAPPVVVSCKVTVADWQTGALPVIVAGVVFTVTTCVAWQPPVVILYVMDDVPAATPVTVPSVPTVAFVGVPLIQAPPGVPSVRLVIRPAHTVGVPVIVPAAALTVTTLVAEQPLPVIV